MKLPKKTKFVENDWDKFGEKCGVVAVWRKYKDAPFYVRRALSSLQHRGQESAGISIFDENNKIKTYKAMGLVPNALTDEALKNLSSGIAIGQNRYSTTGSSSLENAQPISLKKGRHQISIGHNGNIPDCGHILDRIKDRSNLGGKSDTYLVAKLLLQERVGFDSWDKTLLEVLPNLQGAYCFVILVSDGTIYALRDPYGIRPLCFGKLDKGWMIASESVALDLNGAEFLRDVAPGEIIKITPYGDLTSFFFGPFKKPSPCVFEYIYFSRPDSFENGIRVGAAREKAGRLLGKKIMKKGIKADGVLPVFDSGYHGARGVSEVLNLPLIDAITVSHYIGRTFIQPLQEKRTFAVNGKHNIVPDEICGKNIIVVDDSAVRLTTSKRLYQGLKDAGAKNIYFAFASPPVIRQCDLGIDMKSRKELPASDWADDDLDIIEENVASLIGAKNVFYLSIDELALSLGGKKEEYYYYPFGGPHPIRDKQDKYGSLKRKLKYPPEIAVFISGNGTNLQEIIKRIALGDLTAKISAVICNNTLAPGINIAKKNNIPVVLLPFEFKSRGTALRIDYERLLLEKIKKIRPDLIVLAGWNMLIEKDFLNWSEKTQIPVLNLHPALLSPNKDRSIATSRGLIPVVRGVQAIKDAFQAKLPVSGATAHLVLSGNMFDTGPVLVKEEVRIYRHDTLKSFENRIHEVEYRVLTTAIKRILHIMKQGVDVNKLLFI